MPYCSTYTLIVCMHTETDWVFCLELAASPRQEATGWLPVSFCPGRPSLVYFTTFIPLNAVIFDFKMGLFLVSCCRLTQTPLPLFIRMVVLTVVRSIQPLSICHTKRFLHRLVRPKNTEIGNKIDDRIGDRIGHAILHNQSKVKI